MYVCMSAFNCIFVRVNNYLCINAKDLLPTDLFVFTARPVCGKTQTILHPTHSHARKYTQTQENSSINENYSLFNGASAKGLSMLEFEERK